MKASQRHARWFQYEWHWNHFYTVTYDSPMPKPRIGIVKAITGAFKEDVITRDQLEEVGRLQAFEWQAAHTAHRAVEDLMRRLMHGARIEECDLYFDRDLKMVRTKRIEPQSAGPARKRGKKAENE